MKSSTLLTTILVFASVFVLAQDVILTTELDEVQAKVIELTPDLIKYKKWENQAGPIYSLEKSKVFKIKYANGTNEIITKPGSTSSKSSSTSNENTSSSGGFSAENFKSNSEYYIHQAYLVDAASGEIHRLEKGKPELQTKTVAAPFYASSSTSWKMTGDRSNVRLSPNGNYFFAVKLGVGLDPADHIKLKRFDLLKRSRRDKTKDRHMPNSKYSGSVYGGSSEDVSKNDVPCRYESIGDGVYKVFPERLESGNEYAFYIMHKFYAFGID